MCWQNLENKCKEMEYQIVLEHGVSLTNRKFIIAIVSEEFPQLPRVRIAAAVDRCMQKESHPIATHTFLTILKHHL